MIVVSQITGCRTKAAQSPPPIIRTTSALTIKSNLCGVVGAGWDERGGVGACAALVSNTQIASTQSRTPTSIPITFMPLVPPPHKKCSCSGFNSVFLCICNKHPKFLVCASILASDLSPVDAFHIDHCEWLNTAELMPESRILR